MLAKRLAFQPKIKLPVKYTLSLSNNIEEISTLESFMFELPFPNMEAQNRMLIIACELFENVLSHSQGLEGQVHFRVRLDEDPMLLYLVFKTENFEFFVQTYNGQSNRYFDIKTNRYRGLGLSMCAKLAHSIRYRMHRSFNAIIARIPIS